MMVKVKIADLIIDINCDRKYIKDNFLLFELKADDENYIKNADLTWNVHFDNQADDKLEYIIKEIENMKQIVKTKDLEMYVDKNGESQDIIYRYVQKDTIPNAFISKDDFANTDICICDSKNYETDYIQLCLYNIFREIFVIACNYRGKITIHSASIIYKDKAYLFSASSGVGKSTHTNMWVEKYDCKVLDGDVAVCCICEELDEKGNNIKIPYAYGLPWHGTSELYLNEKVEFGGIVFLKRGQINEIKELDISETALNMYINNFIPLTTEIMVDNCMDNITLLSQYVPGYELRCLPNFEAVEVTKQCIVKN